SFQVARRKTQNASDDRAQGPTPPSVQCASILLPGHLVEEGTTHQGLAPSCRDLKHPKLVKIPIHPRNNDHSESKYHENGRLETLNSRGTVPDRRMTQEKQRNQTEENVQDGRLRQGKKPKANARCNEEPGSALSSSDNEPR